MQKITFSVWVITHLAHLAPRAVSQLLPFLGTPVLSKISNEVCVFESCSATRSLRALQSDSIQACTALQRPILVFELFLVGCNNTFVSFSWEA